MASCKPPWYRPIKLWRYKRSQRRRKDTLGLLVKIYGPEFVKSLDDPRRPWCTTGAPRPNQDRIHCELSEKDAEAYTKAWEALGPGKVEPLPPTDDKPETRAECQCSFCRFVQEENERRRRYEGADFRYIEDDSPPVLFPKPEEEKPNA